jgi:hypothetical protein
MHAYGEAIDVKPVENPYVGCGMTRGKTAISYMNRSNVRKGMVTPAVLAAFWSSPAFTDSLLLGPRSDLLVFGG